MGTILTSEDEVDALRKALGTQATNLISTAIAVGWKAMLGADNNVSLIAPGDPTPKRLHMSPKGKGGGDFASMTRSLMRYGDQESVSRLKKAAKNSSATDESFITSVMTEIALHEVAAILDDVQTKSQDVPVVVKSAFGQVIEKALATPVGPYIVTERPALMHYSLSASRGGRSYPSKTAVERKWSNGTTDFRCAISTCDGVSDNHRSFAGPHWAKHVRNGEAQQMTDKERHESLVDDPSYTETAYNRISGVINRNPKVEAIVDTTPLDAPVILSQPDLTPEQVIEQIRLLVGIEDQQPVIELQLQRIRQLEAAMASERDAHAVTLATLREENRQITENLKIIRDMLSELTK